MALILIFLFFSFILQLQAEKKKAAAKIGGLEDEIDDLKERLKNLKHKAGREVMLLWS